LVGREGGREGGSDCAAVGAVVDNGGRVEEEGEER